MDHLLHETLPLLTRTPAVLEALLRALPDTWTSRTEGEDTWSPALVVGHLIHCERTNWMPRARTLLQGHSKALPPFDRFGHLRETEGRSLEALLNEFARVRSENLDELRSWNLQPDQLTRQGQHPALGVVTLSELLATWAVHDLTHLHQITRIMAHQFREAVGPWERYLGVLHCEGHGAS